MVRAKFEELKETKKTIKKQIEELKELDKMKIEFLNITSHELKTPLTQIIAYLDILQNEKQGKLNKNQKESLKIISSNTKRLKSLIWDILDLSGLESKQIKFDMQPIKINEVIEDAIRDVKSLAEEKNITINKNLGNFPLIEGDEERLKQVITNLVNNAIKFTPKRGKIDINVGKKSYRLFITVKDMGIGIKKIYLEKIFDKFYQVDTGDKRKYSGTGLGLTICQGIIKAHGGEIWAESEPKKGSAFNILLYYKRLGKPTEAFTEAFSKRGGGGKK